MKKIIVLVGVVLSCCFVSPAYSVEACFDLGTQYYNMNGVDRLSLWAIAEANGNEVYADARNSWQSEFSIAAWYATLLKAQEMGLQVVVAFDPGNYEIWYIARPRSCTPSF